MLYSNNVSVPSSYSDKTSNKISTLGCISSPSTVSRGLCKPELSTSKFSSSKLIIKNVLSSITKSRLVTSEKTHFKSGQLGGSKEVRKALLDSNNAKGLKNVSGSFTFKLKSGRSKVQFKGQSCEKFSKTLKKVKLNGEGKIIAESSTKLKQPTLKSDCFKINTNKNSCGKDLKDKTTVDNKNAVLSKKHQNNFASRTARNNCNKHNVNENKLDYLLPACLAVKMRANNDNYKINNTSLIDRNLRKIPGQHKFVSSSVDCGR